MSAASIDLIRSVYEAFARGDAGTVLAAFDPQIEWNEAEGFRYADRNPYVGPAQVAEGVFGRLLAEWDGFSVVPERYIDGGETVVATGRYRGVFRATGRRLDAQFAHLWTVRDGRIAGFQQYTDTAQTARVTEALATPPLA